MADLDQPATDPEPDRDELLALATDLATRAAELLVDGLRRTRTTVESKSTVTDMVTEMDRASERLIVDGILAARPTDGILGEEGTDRAGTSGLRWVIDPLDGTTNYVYGHPGFGVSIAIEQVGLAEADHHGRRTVVAAVVDPLHGDVFGALAGRGAWRNGEPIACSTETSLGHALVGTGFGYDAARRARQAEVLTSVLPKVRDIRRMGAAAVDLCSVACGRIDAFYERGLAPWDHAAGALVAAEAGAVVVDLAGGIELSTFCLAAPPALLTPLGDLLRAARADDA